MLRKWVTVAATTALTAGLLSLSAVPATAAPENPTPQQTSTTPPSTSPTPPSGSAVVSTTNTSDPTVTATKRRKPPTKPSPPTPAPTPSPTPTEPEILTKTEIFQGAAYEFSNAGFLTYERPPALENLPGTQQWAFRGVSNYPVEPYGTGRCYGRYEGSTFYPPLADVCGGSSNSISTSELMCYNSYTVGPSGIRNYSYGTSWAIDRRYYYIQQYQSLDNGETWQTVGAPTRGAPIPGATGYRVRWGNCQYYAYPYIETRPCVIEIGPITLAGPTGQGLPTVSDYTGRVIPESEYTATTLKSSNGQTYFYRSPLGQAYRNGGTQLSGAGGNDAKLALVQNCNNFAAPPPAVDELYYGNWKLDSNNVYITCEIVRFPGFGLDVFKGCSGPTTRTVTEYKIVTCNPDNMKRVRMRTAGAPDLTTDFSPQGMGCETPICQWTNSETSQTGLDRRTFGNGTSLVWSDQNPDTLLRPGRTDGRIYTVANGYTLNIQAPRLTMRVQTTSDNQPTNAGLKWTFFEVNRGSTPWKTINGEPIDNPNAADQPFTSRFRDEKGVLSAPRSPDANSNYCVDGDVKNCVRRDGLQDIAKRASLATKQDINPIVLANNSWARNLMLNFYRPSSTSNYGDFSVRSVYAQTWNTTHTFPTLGNITAGGIQTGARTIERDLDITLTCTTDWTNITVLKDRITG